jgi:hypothetical protein
MNHDRCAPNKEILKTVIFNSDKALVAAAPTPVMGGQLQNVERVWI